MCKELLGFRFLLMMIAWFAHRASNFLFFFFFLGYLWLQHHNWFVLVLVCLFSDLLLLWEESCYPGGK
jgi:hypothetical protein